MAGKVTGKGAGYDPRLAHALDLPTGGDAFDWKLANSYYVETRLDGAASGKSLSVRMSPDFRDRPARILLLLPPGTYKLASQLRTLSPRTATARWTIECAQSNGVQIAALPLARASGQTSFSVNPACQAQWLALELSNKPSTAEDVQAEIAALSLTRAE